MALLRLQEGLSSRSVRSRCGETEGSFLRCVEPGRWLTCSACAEAHSAAQLIPRDALQQKLCANCGEEKLDTYFAEGCAWCSPCELRNSFCCQECGSCRKWKYTHAFTAGDDEMAESLPICSACSPQHQQYTCTVCDKNTRETTIRCQSFAKTEALLNSSMRSLLHLQHLSRTEK